MEQLDDTNKTAEVMATMQQSEGRMIAWSLEQDIRESSVGSTKDTQATNSNQDGIDKVERQSNDQNQADRQSKGNGNQSSNGHFSQVMALLHNQWLHGIMWAAMGNKAHPDIPNLVDYKYTPRVAPDYKIKVEPPHNHVIRYNLQIKVTTGKNQVELSIKLSVNDI